MPKLTIARENAQGVTELVQVESKWPPEDKEYEKLQERIGRLEHDNPGIEIEEW